MVSERDVLKIAVVIGIVLIAYFALNTLQIYAKPFMTSGTTALVVGLLLLGGILAYKRLTS